MPYWSLVGCNDFTRKVCFDNLAMLRKKQDCIDQAIFMHLRALQMREEAMEPNHPDVAASCNNLGFCTGLKVTWIRQTSR